MTITTEATTYCIWDVRNAEIFDNIIFDTVLEAVEYGNNRLPYFWADNIGLYTIREL